MLEGGDRVFESEPCASASSGNCGFPRPFVFISMALRSHLNENKTAILVLAQTCVVFVTSEFRGSGSFNRYAACRVHDHRVLDAGIQQYEQRAYQHHGPSAAEFVNPKDNIQIVSTAIGSVASRPRVICPDSGSDQVAKASYVCRSSPRRGLDSYDGSIPRAPAAR